MFDYKKVITEDVEKSEMMKKIDKIGETYECASQAMSNMIGTLVKDCNIWSRMGMADEKSMLYFGDIMQLLGATNEMIKTTFEYEKESVKKIEEMDKKLDTLGKSIESLQKVIESQNELIKTLRKAVKE